MLDANATQLKETLSTPSDQSWSATEQEEWKHLQKVVKMKARSNISGFSMAVFDRLPRNVNIGGEESPIVAPLIRVPRPATAPATRKKVRAKKGAKDEAPKPAWTPAKRNMELPRVKPEAERSARRRQKAAEGNPPENKKEKKEKKEAREIKREKREAAESEMPTAKPAATTKPTRPASASLGRRTHATPGGQTSLRPSSAGWNRPASQASRPTSAGPTRPPMATGLQQRKASRPQSAVSRASTSSRVTYAPNVKEEDGPAVVRTEAGAAGEAPRWHIVHEERELPAWQEKEESEIANRVAARCRKPMSSTTMLSRTKSGLRQLSKSGRSLHELIEKTSLKVSQQTILKASELFQAVAPATRKVDMNQWDVVMRRLGVNNAVLRHKVFMAFDADNNNSVDYDEFITGLTALWQGAVANKYAGLWRKLCCSCDRPGKKRLVMRDILAMLEASKIASDRGELMGYVEHLMHTLDVNHDRGITYDEFQLGCLRDSKTAAIFDKIMNSSAFHVSINTFVQPIHSRNKLPQSALLNTMGT